MATNDHQPLNDLSDKQIEKLVTSAKEKIEAGASPLLATKEELLDRVNKNHLRSA